MRRLRWLTFAALGVLSACKPPDAALKVTVTLKAQGTNKVRADCVKLAVLDGDVEKKSIVIKRQTDDVMVFGVLRGSDLPKSVNLQASALLGDCTDDGSLRLNAQGSFQAATFPESGVVAIDLDLEPPNSMLDGDRDGYVAAANGGPDCADNDSTIFPGALQRCDGTVDTDCNGSVSCDDPGCASDLFCVAQADRVVLTSGLRTMLRGDCLGPVRVELQNAVGPRTAVRDTPVTFASSITGVTTHTTSSCNDMAITSLPILFGETFVEVWLKADEQAFGTNTFTATAAMVPMSGSIMIEVHPRAVSRLTFTNTPITVGAGSCSATPLTLQFFDMQNRPTDVDSPSTINLSSAPNDVMNRNIFFSDPGCNTAAPTLMLQAGQGTASVYVNVQRAGTFTVTAAPSVGMPDAQMMTVTASTPSKLEFINAPLALITTNPCSLSPLQLQLQDQYGNPAQLPTALPLQLSVTGPSNVSFFAGTDATCMMGALSTFSMPANTTTLALRVGASTVGSNTITATPTVMVPPITGAMQGLIVSAGQASRFAWIGQAQSPLAGVCSSSPLTIELRDGSDSPASSPMAQNITLSTVPAADPSFHFFSGAGCVNDIGTTANIPAGQISTTVYFRGNRAVPSFEIRGAGSLTAPATQSVGHSIGANVPAKLSFGAPLAQTAQAGNCSPAPYVVNVLDQYDNPTSFGAAQTLTVSSNPSGVTIGPAGNCMTGNSTTLGAGMQSASFTARHTVTSPVTPYQLTATVSGFSTATPATFNVTPGTATLQVDNPLNGMTTMTAGNCQNVTLTRRDSFGNNAPTSGNNNITLTLPTGMWEVFPGQNCMAPMGTPTMNSTHTTAFSMRPRTSGSHMVTATVAGTSANIAFSVNPAAPTLIFETPNTGTATASASQSAGGCTLVAVARKDAFGNDVPLGVAGDLTFVLPAGTTAHSDAACMNGIANIPLTTADVRAQFYVKATVAGVQSVQAVLATQIATLTLTVNPGGATASWVTPVGGVTSVPANMACVQLQVERRDMFNNLVPVPVGTTSFTVVGPAAMSVFDSANCSTTALTQMPAGTSTVPVAMGASSKTFSVRLTSASNPMVTVNFPGGPLTLNLTVTPGPLAVLALEGFTSPFTAGACSGALQVRRRDNFMNDIINDPPTAVVMTSPLFSFSTTASTCAGAMVGPFNVNIPTGSATSTVPFYVTATQATAPGTTTLTATSGSVMAVTTATINPATATQLLFPTAATTGTAGTCSAGGFSVEMRDAFNNLVRPSSSTTVTFTPSLSANFGPGAVCSGTVAITSANPTPTFSMQGITAGTNTVTASVTTPALMNTFMVNVAPGTANTLLWRTNPTASPTRFTCASAGVIESRDGNNNLSNVASNLTVNLVSSNPTLTFFSDALCTTPITSTTIAMGTDATPTVYMWATGDVANVTATAMSFTTTPSRTVTPGGATGVLAVSPANPDLEAGACVAMTITRQDQGPAVFTTGVTSLTASVMAGIGVTLHTVADCSTAGAASVPLTITQGNSTATIYARGRSAAVSGATPNNVSFTVASTGSMMSGTPTFKVYPLVRRGACNLTATNTSNRCTLTLPIPGNDITRSFLVFTSTGRPATTGPASITAGDQNVECHLEAGATVDVVCSRATASAGTNTMQVTYQVVSFGRDAASGFGVSVQHPPSVTTSTTMATTTQTFMTAVDTSKSFLLVSGTLNDALNNGEGFPLVKFSSTGASVNSIDIVANTATPTGRTVSYQVVTLGLPSSGVIHTDVNAPVVGGGPAFNYTVTTTATPTAQSFALTMAQVIDGTNPETMCRRRFNTKVTGTTTFTLHRATATQPASCVDAQSTVTAFATQRVNLGTSAAVRTQDVTFTNSSTASTNPTITGGSLVPHRSICLLGMQGPGGQTAGEANFVGSNQDGDDTGPFHATLDFNAAGDRIVVTREVSGNTTSTFSPVMVQFDP